MIRYLLTFLIVGVCVAMAATVPDKGSLTLVTWAPVESLQLNKVWASDSVRTYFRDRFGEDMPIVLWADRQMKDTSTIIFGLKYYMPYHSIRDSITWDSTLVWGVIRQSLKLHIRDIDSEFDTVLALTFGDSAQRPETKIENGLATLGHTASILSGDLPLADSGAWRIWINPDSAFISPLRTYD